MGKGERLINNAIDIHGKKIGPDYPPFIIAEMSGNHNQSLDRALKIVDAAANAGAQALKIQTYTPDTMTLNLSEGDFLISDPQSLWKGESLYNLYKKAYTPWEWHKPIFERCKQNGLIGFSSPFDATAVDFLEDLNVPLYKIASFENTDIPLIKKVVETGKPVIISTGMATLEELEETMKAVEAGGKKDVILLKCTSTYPAPPDQSHLRRIPDMIKRFNCVVGLSDHTLGIGVSIASVAIGASLIERHFTLDRTEGGVDSAFSLEPKELKQLVEASRNAWEAMGNIHYGPTESEEKSLQFRRSLYIAEDMKAGDTFNPINLRAIRPGRGLPPKYYEQVLGKKVKTDVKKGTPLKLELIT